MYVRPKMGSNEIYYKGRRFWVVKVNDESGFEYVNKDDYDLVVWDCREGFALGMVNIVERNKFQCFSIIPWPTDKPIFDKIATCIQWLNKEIDTASRY